MMPSTSVQIHSSEASNAAARMDAEKSEPPRPSVVGRPSTVAALNPVITGSTPFFSIGSKRCRAFSRVGPINGEALPKTASVTMTSTASTTSADTPSEFRYSATRSAESRSPVATASSADRGGRMLSMAMPPAMRSNSAISLWICAMTAAWRGAGSNSRQASSWRERKAATSVSMPVRSPASAWRMASSSRSVILDMAETTIATGRRPRSSTARRAATRIRAAEPTLVPPNFITSRSFNGTPFRW